MARRISATKTPQKKMPTKALSFLEELSWLFERFGVVQVKEYVSEIEQKLKENSTDSITSTGLEKFSPKNPNQLFLIGILPKIFSDEKLFASNKELAEFSRDILSVSISRWEKRSRYEIIGHIVCNVAIADDFQLKTIAAALRKLQNEDNSEDFLKKSLEKNMTWNDIIRILLEKN